MYYSVRFFLLYISLIISYLTDTKNKAKEKKTLSVDICAHGYYLFYRETLIFVLNDLFLFTSLIHRNIFKS